MSIWLNALKNNLCLVFKALHMSLKNVRNLGKGLGTYQLSESRWSFSVKLPLIKGDLTPWLMWCVTRHTSFVSLLRVDCGKGKNGFSHRLFGNLTTSLSLHNCILWLHFQSEHKCISSIKCILKFKQRKNKQKVSNWTMI